ncbi:peptide ABC transporter substrate-binding protein [Magnetospirillum sp. 64-120]|uniref:peptide ABC transporter substrate-binding protein n=1 Tax=Magnetospirillum sp. 64-120 TaxID=1895778 RepID=UPI000926F4AE|nr:peptide ABC transporter substrate-binding protein [Magnetospirillum sp. 64-120]OJX79481.1 MAG: peptide ABC transporter [Magnetospirillum sp. 64-120]
MPRLTSLLLILALCLTASLPARAKDDLVIGITQFPSTLHPNLDSMMAKTYVMAMTARPLTVFDAKWRVVCMLCEQLPSFDNGLAKREKTPDGKPGVALTFTLRPDLYWGDGVPVTSKDVVFTWEMGKHPQSGVANGEMYRRILAIDVQNDKTFTLHLDRLTFDYNVMNGLLPIPAHLERAAFLADPAQYRVRNGYDQKPAQPGLYNGPYVITQVVAGSHLMLEPNPFWKGKQPQFKRLVVRAVENTAALEAQLLSGGVDMIAGELGLPLEQAVGLEKRADPRFRVIFKSGLVFEHVDVNLDSPILSDRRVRQALMFGLDRQSMNRQLFDGRQPVADSSVNPLDGVYAEDVPKYAHDPVRAAQMLDDAGWKMAGGLRRNAKGEPLSVELITTAGNRSRELVSQVIQAQWRKLGVDVRLKAEPPRVFFAETVTKRRFPHLALYAWISAPESVPRTTLHSTQIPNAANTWAGQNNPGYANPAMDKLLDDIETELDATKRGELWRQLQHLYATDLPALPLFFRADAYILPKALEGVEPTGHQDPSTLWVENWRWRP